MEASEVVRRWLQGPRRRKRADGLALAGYILLAAIFYAPLLLGLRRFPDGDFTHHFLPFSLFLREELLAGRLPIWNPYTYSGHPFLADIQAAVLYPLGDLILLLTLPWGTPGARLYFLEAEAALHLALAGFFTYLLARDLTGHRGAAFLAGCAFALSGYLTGYPPLQLAILRTAIWLPLVLWLLLRGMSRPTQWRWWTGAALAYAMALLAGHAQTFLFLSYAVSAWIVLLLTWTVRRGLPSREIAHRVLGVVGFALLALGVSAAQLWPSVEFARLSTRAHADYAYLSGGFPLRDTWQLLLPGVLTWFSPLYVSVAALGLALMASAHVLSGDRRKASSGFLPARWGILFFAGVALFFLLLSYGGNGFLYPLFYRWAPGGRLFRGQERAAYGVAFGLSVLAGYGAASLGRLPARTRRAVAWTFAGVIVAGVVVFGLGWQRPGHTAVPLRESLAIAGAVCAFALASSLAIATERAARWRVPILTLLIVSDLFLANFTTNLAEGGPAAWTSLPPEAEAVQAAVTERATANLGLPGRVYNEYRVYEDYGMVARVEDVWGSSPLRLARYAMLFEDFPLDRMWRLTGVEHVLTWRRELFEPSTLLAEFPQETDTTYLHRLKEPNPRAWVTHDVVFADDEETKRLLADHQFDLETTAVLPVEARDRTTLENAEVGPSPPAGESTIRLERLAPYRLLVRGRSDREGLLIVSENWMPGWRALRRDEGAQTLPVFRADLTFLGIPVPAGEWEVELIYRPDSVRLGLLISELSLALLCVVSIWRWRWGRRR
ncbi:MAG: YfhO family protein [Chloroflexi bacterium]|nr:YfhO family protein [Chloroflexota bacterium]